MPDGTLTRVKLLARSRPHGDSDADAHEWTVEATTYDDALAEAQAALTDDWDLLSVQIIEP